MKKAWDYLLAEPFTWMFYAFFQPSRLEREFVPEGRWQRFILMLRVILPMILLAYPIGVIGHLLLIPFHLVLHTEIVSILLETALGIAFGIVGGIAFGIAGEITFGIAFGIVGGIALGIVGGIAGGIAFSIAFSIALGIVGGIAEGIVSGIVLGIVGGIAFGIAGGIAGGIAFGITFGITFGIVPEKEGGITGGIVSGIALGIVSGIAGGIALGIVGGIAEGIIVGVVTTLSFIVCCFMGVFGLPFYLVSGPSALRAYHKSRKNSSQVFAYLQRSSLHWDEIVYLPLPYLKETLLIAYDENPERALEEIAFIAAERPRQLRAARGALLEVAIRDLETRKKMTEIAEAAQFLDELFPQETKLLDPQWTLPITRLREASQDATRFCSPVGRRARLEALQDMIKQVKSVRPNASFRDAQLGGRFAKVVDVWLAVAQQEQERLEQLPDFLGRVDNPYNPGNALKPNDPLFFGRLDLVHVLEMELTKGERRPTFLMTGERRMGKSSTLLQLPRLLGSRFLPIFYDLQSPGIFASTSTFLGTLADGIHKEMNARSMPIDRLVYRTLRGSQQSSSRSSTPQSHSESYVSGYEEGASAAYNLFGEWLKDVELALEREDRTLLLLLDEFEKLEEAGRRRAFDLPLLLDWFRTIIQYHPRIALLFSGVHSFSEMGKETNINWSGYFVNVQTLSVSFLHKDEARRLITRPVRGFPGEEIYGDGVVERIITETGCHPFLVQAVCSALIDHLNVEKKERAELKDVARAVNRAFTNWWDTYFRDLWLRTDEHQRACLIALRALTIADREHIRQQSGLDEKVVRRTLHALLRRDLVRQNEDDTYCISTPIFSAWVERSRDM